MFPPPEETILPRRQPHSKKKPEKHIPRPPNAFILFRSFFIHSQHVSTEVESNHATLSKIIGITWQSLPEEERQVWNNKAKEVLDEHRRKFPKYAFRPQKGAPSERRKVREVEWKDIKRCTNMARSLSSLLRVRKATSSTRLFKSSISTMSQRSASASKPQLMLTPSAAHHRPQFLIRKTRAPASRVSSQKDNFTPIYRPSHSDYPKPCS